MGGFTKFRPCIDIHNGKVKQIVGGSLKDAGDQAKENFVSEQNAAFYARLYKKSGIKGGHVILLNGADSPYYEATREQAFLALHEYPGGLQLGGGVNPDNAEDYLQAGASHVIVTSYVFKNGQISWENLDNAVAAYDKLIAKIATLKKDGDVDEAVLAKLKEKFVGALNGDLNTSLAITAMYDVLKEKTNDATKLAALADFDTVLSLNLLSAAEALQKKQAEEEAANADPEIDALVAARTAAKKAKNFAEADRIRDELKARGIEIMDTPQGAKWRKV